MISNIIKKFYKQKIADTEPKITKESDQPQNCLIFTFDQDLKVLSKIKFYGTTQIEAIAFAEMLYDLSFGAYNKNILNILQTMGEDMPEIAEFINKILINYNIFISYQKDKEITNHTQTFHNEPIVKPSHFYQKYNPGNSQ